MKRPEGFDPPGRSQPTPPGRKPVQPSRKGTAPAGSPPRAQPASPTLRNRPTSAEAPPPPTPSPRPKPAGSRRAPRPSDAGPRPDASARAELRRAVRERRRFERAEVRRFTRRARNRRLTAAIGLGVIVALLSLILAAVFSPILALREIRIEGASRVDPIAVHDAVSGQLGTPLALLDAGRMTTELSQFPLIRSYVTQIIPPETLVIRLVERQPVGAIGSGARFTLVDPAGVVIQEMTERPTGIPLISIGAASTSSDVFDSVVEVLLALPPGLLTQVDSVSATTRDDVSLVLTGVGQRVTWGSADGSDQKAALLAALIAVTDPSIPGEFDVSAPSNGVFRPA